MKLRLMYIFLLKATLSGLQTLGLLAGLQVQNTGVNLCQDHLIISPKKKKRKLLLRGSFLFTIVRTEYLFR